MYKQVLKVGMNTKPASAAGAIAGYLKDGKQIEVIAIGAQAVNQANKAMIIARGFLIQSGIIPLFEPEFTNLVVDGQEKTAIKWVVRTSTK